MWKRSTQHVLSRTNWEISFLSIDSLKLNFRPEREARTNSICVYPRTSFHFGERLEKSHRSQRTYYSDGLTASWVSQTLRALDNFNATSTIIQDHNANLEGLYRTLKLYGIQKETLQFSIIWHNGNWLTILVIDMIESIPTGSIHA